MRDMKTIWTRIEAHAGHTFHQVEGGEFIYQIKGRTLKPDRTNRNIPKSDFEKTLNHVPFTSTTEVNRLGVQGAILRSPPSVGMRRHIGSRHPSSRLRGSGSPNAMGGSSRPTAMG